jgi:ABC-2 type transport system ATP-binding protein
VVSIHRSDGKLYQVEAESDLRPEVARAVVEADGWLLSLGVETPSLDEIYTHYFQKEEVEHGAAHRGS